MAKSVALVLALVLAATAVSDGWLAVYSPAEMNDQCGNFQQESISLFQLSQTFSHVMSEEYKEQLEKMENRTQQALANGKSAEDLTEQLDLLNDQSKYFILSTSALFFALLSLVLILAAALMDAGGLELRVPVLVLCIVCAVMQLIALGCGCALMHKIFQEEEETDNHRLAVGESKSTVEASGYQVWSGPICSALTIVLAIGAGVCAML